MDRSMDRSVGKILQALKEEGLDENTIVIFTSDNGAPSSRQRLPTSIRASSGSVRTDQRQLLAVRLPDGGRWYGSQPDAY